MASGAGDVDEDRNNEALALTFVSSGLSAPQVKDARDYQSNITSNYHNITSLKVPIAESESDLEIPANEDEEEEEEEEKCLSEVKSCQFFVIRHEQQKTVKKKLFNKTT